VGDGWPHDVGLSEGGEGCEGSK